MGGAAAQVGPPSLPPSGVTHKGEDRITLAGHIILRVSGKGTGSQRPAREASLMKHTEEEEGKRGIYNIRAEKWPFVYSTLEIIQTKAFQAKGTYICTFVLPPGECGDRIPRAINLPDDTTGEGKLPVPK